MSFIAFDLEIKEHVDNVRRTWNDARLGKCGISVVCCWDSDDQRYLFFDEHNLGDCMDYLATADTLVGFNSLDFDLPVLQSVSGSVLPPVPHFDILQVVWQALGTRKKGYKLGEICQRTIGRSKLLSGDLAPDLYAEGRFAELYSYCLHDVMLTKELFEHIIRERSIIDVNGNPLEVLNLVSVETWQSAGE